MAERFHGLDALRAGAMLLGVILHAALVYTEPAVQAAMRPGADPVPAGVAVTGIVLWIHLWRIPLFFILAGFFAQMVLVRRGAPGFLGDRAVRILATCLLFVFLFNAMTGQAAGTLDHLWFLWVLWWCCVMAAGLHGIGLSGHLRVIARLFATPRRMLWLAVPLTLMSLFLRDETVVQRIPALLTDVELRGFVFCILFFWAGQALWGARERLADLARPGIYPPLLAVGALATGTILLGAVLFGEEEALLTEDVQLALLLTAAPLAGIATGASSFGFIGLAQHLITAPSRMVSGLVRLAYPVYVFHLWFALGVSVAILDANPEINQLLNLALTSVAAFVASVLVYVAFVRFTPLEWLFAGRKHAWWQWPFTEKGRPEGRPQNLVEKGGA